jgi:hypothetical protein
MRAPLLLAAVAVVCAVVPSASADAPPSECVTYLRDAPSGASAGCTTLSGPSTISGSYAARQVSLMVVTGEASATLTCAGDPAVSVTVTLAKPGTATDYVVGYGNCWVTLTAQAAGTTAVAGNTTAYVFP